MLQRNFPYSATLRGGSFDPHLFTVPVVAVTLNEVKSLP